MENIELIKSDWSIQSCFAEFRRRENAAIRMGAILLTIDQQEEICKMVDQFYVHK